MDELSGDDVALELATAVSYRRHGCQAPLNPWQIGAVVAHYASTGITLGLMFSSFPVEVPVVVFIVVGFCLHIVATVLYFWTSLIDTTDLCHMDDETTLEMFCDRCKCRVDSSSKHCRACDKCVIGFDHHCVWLNCCIGLRNYKQFFSLLVSLFLLLAFQASADATMLVWAVSTNKDGIMSGSGISPACTVVLLVAALATKVTGAVLVADLLLFHIILKLKGLATYDYVLATEDHVGKECCGVNVKFIPFAETCAAAPCYSKVKISVCRALQTTAEAGRAARSQKRAHKIVPLLTQELDPSATPLETPLKGVV